MLNKLQIANTVRYVWLILASGLVLYVMSQNIVTGRSLVYNLDFKNSVTPNITGWYPESRTFFDAKNNHLQILAEPIYLQAYWPLRGQLVTVKGNFPEYIPGMRLGLRQKNGDWQFKNINQADFSLDFDTQAAQIKQNKIEFILALSDLAAGPVILENNWQIILTR